MNKVTINRIGLVAIWLFFMGDIFVGYLFGSMYPGYNWLQQSISYLGQAGSPLEKEFLAWGIMFGILLFLFAFAFFQHFRHWPWARWATFCIVLYGLGEGFGSGLFPINPPGTPGTLDAQLHNILSGIGDAGIIILPFLLMVMFRNRSQKFIRYLWAVIGIGGLMVSFFLVAKYFQPDNFILHFKGVWQRIFTVNYHFMLIVVNFFMNKKWPS